MAGAGGSQGIGKPDHWAYVWLQWQGGRVRILLVRQSSVFKCVCSWVYRDCKHGSRDTGAKRVTHSASRGTNESYRCPALHPTKTKPFWMRCCLGGGWVLVEPEDQQIMPSP